MVLNRMAKGNDQWLPFLSFCLRGSVALATPKPLIFQRGSRDALEGDFPEAWRGSEDRGRRGGSGET